MTNDHPREIYNGDLGIVRRIDLKEGELVVLVGQKKALSIAVRGQ